MLIDVPGPDEPTLILFRGLPSSGKTTFVSMFFEPLSADDYPGLYEGGKFRGMEMVDGVPMIVLAHQWCQAEARGLMESGYDMIGVANTFTQRWEMEPYLVMAEELGYRTFVVDLYDGGKTDAELAERNTHGVPVEGIKAMRDRYEYDWKNGSPVRPARK